MSKRKLISKELREQVYLKYSKRCAYCGEFISIKQMQVDHFAPVYLFGDNIKFENLMPACRSCNLYKSTLTIEKFREQLSQIPFRLSRDVTIYNIAKRFNLIKENYEPIEFYFEKVQREAKIKERS